MFRVLVIDDEPYVREGLKSVIDWESVGFQICGESSDGNDGLKKILQLKPDLTMIDIRMPGMHGIQVIEQARKHEYNGKFIILTGFSDFNDAQSAIRLDVHSFLLKPIDENELIDSLITLKKELESEYEVKNNLNIYLKTVKKNIVADILSSKGEHYNNDEYMRLYGLDMNYSAFQVAVIKCVSDDHYNQEAIQDFFSNEKNINTVIIDGTVVLLLKGNSILRLNGILKLLNKTLLIKDCIKIFTGVGRTVTEQKDIAISFQDAKKIVSRVFIYLKGENIIYWDDVKGNFEQDGNKKSIDIFPYFDKIYIYIEVGDIEGLEVMLTELERNCRLIDIQPERITPLFLNIYLKLKMSVVANYKDINCTLPDDKEIMNSIYSKSTLHEIIDYLKAEFTKISSQICNCSSENVVKRMVIYINKNYSKNLKLENLADIFGYNSAYLGKIFKNSIGESFNTYLDNVRIENAKTLLMDKKLKVYEISEQIGYKNIDYFYRKFKTYVKMSPKEYVTLMDLPQKI